MNPNFLFFCVCIHIFNEIICSSYNFSKYGSFSTKEGHAIFDPTEFEIGEYMYFKITAKEFNNDELGYEYLDEIPDNYNFEFNDDKLTVKSHHKSEGKDDDEIESETRFYKIEKKQQEIGNLKGNYLILYFDCDGKVEIENTKKDVGKIKFIITLVISIIAVIAIIILTYFCVCRKKKDSNEDKKSDTNEDKDKNNENNENNPNIINYNFQQTYNQQGNAPPPPQNYSMNPNNINNINNNMRIDYYNNMNNFNNTFDTFSNINIIKNENNNNNNNFHNNQNNNIINYRKNNIYNSCIEGVNKVQINNLPQNNQLNEEYNVIPFNSNENREGNCNEKRENQI